MLVYVIADTHGEVEKVQQICDFMRKRPCDALVFAGDVTDYSLLMQGYDPMDMAQLILENVCDLGFPVLAVPGNCDPKEILKLFDEFGINLHGKSKIIKDVGFAGFGGAKTPFKTLFEPTEEETKEGLGKAWEGLKECKRRFLVTHNPAKGTKLDMISSGAHVGSDAIREFILANSPDVAASAHVHESSGIDSLNRTHLIYPGRATEGFLGVVSIGETIESKIVNVFK